MNCQFGIHLGNNNVCLAVSRDSNIDVVSNKAGDRVTPTILAVLDEDEYVVGETAKQRLGRTPGATVLYNLQFCNTALSADDLLEVAKSCVCKVETTPEFKYILEINEITKEITPYRANVEIFRNVLSSAHQICHGDDQNAEYPVVISIPDYFNLDSGKEIRRAAQSAGFKVEQIIKNSAAAVLGYNIGQDDASKSETVFVYRIGGHTVECSIVNVDNGLYEIENSIYRNHLGGNIFTKAIAKFVSEEFFNKYKLNPNESKRSMAKLLYHVEQSKHVLSTMPSTQIFIESLIDGIDVNSNMSRARFESLIAPHLSKFREPVEALLESRKDKSKKIDRVILCGGSMKIPKLQSTIAEMFPDSEILSSIAPDEVIAIGCARQAALNPGELLADVEGLYTDIQLVPHDIYIKSSEDDGVLAFPRGSQTYTTFKFNQTIADAEKTLDFSIYEKHGDGEIVNLGTIDVALTPKTGNVEFVAVLKPTLIEISCV